MSRNGALVRATDDGALATRDGNELSDSSALVEREIERTRERIAASLARLRTEMSAVTDWRQQYARRPWVFVAGALGVGLLLGLVTGTRKEKLT